MKNKIVNQKGNINHRAACESFTKDDLQAALFVEKFGVTIIPFGMEYRCCLYYDFFKYQAELYGTLIVILSLFFIIISGGAHMDNSKVGNLIYTLRKEKQMTQLQLAQLMNISDKTVSKWERGLGCPDVSLLPELSKILGVHLENLLSGEVDTNDLVGGNMKKLKFYICPQCGNLLTATAEAAISCCGKKLEALEPYKATEEEKLKVDNIEDDYFISADHPMTKEHYIAFVALLTGDSVILRKQYPEWGLQARIPAFAHGILVWYCTNHGLFYQLL